MPLKTYSSENYFFENICQTSTSRVYPEGTFVCDVYCKKTKDYKATVPVSRIITHVLIEQNTEGFAYVITKPTKIESIVNMMDIRPSAKGYSYKILTDEQALKHQKLIGKEYIINHFKS